MATTAATTAAPTHDRTTARPQWLPFLGTGIAAIAVASAATAATAALASAAGVSREVSGEPIPVSGFAVLTALFSLVGLALAAALARWAARPRRAFLTATVALTALSLLPSLTADAAWSTRALLVATHLVAAAIVIPALARRLRA
ncbi:DUF6069 family protein [Motilibacter deserti]|uniref:DUF6069 family protein n=1 Tax=Motilibacter deserti TaxID=2714956 RepID=UPI001E52E093|nr:DUF6069 family protein [Motilibacter deserti]